MTSTQGSAEDTAQDPTETTPEPERPRTHGMGSADAPTVLGLNRFKDRYTLWAEKRGLVPKAEVGEPAYWGRHHEPNILRRYAEGSGHTVAGTIGWQVDDVVRLYMPDGEVVDAEQPHLAKLLGILTHKVYSWMVLRMDGIVLEHGTYQPMGFLEAKSVGEWVARDLGWHEGVPPDTEAQVLHASEVTASHGLDLPWLCPVLVGGNRYYEHQVDINHELRPQLVRVERAFWMAVLMGTPPPVDAEAEDALRQLHPHATERELPSVAGDELHMVAERMRRAQLDKTEAERVEQACRAVLMDEMEDAGRIAGEGWTVTWREGKPKAKVGYKAALVQFRNVMEIANPGLVGGGYTAAAIIALLDAAITEHTEMGPATRAFRPNLRRLDVPALPSPQGE